MKFDLRKCVFVVGFIAALVLAPVQAAEETDITEELARLHVRKPSSFEHVPLQAFFPPPAPVYGAPLKESIPKRFWNGHAIEPPEDLGKYVSEFFYPPLSTWLFLHHLDAKLAQRLEAYMAVHRELLNEFQNMMVSVQLMDSETRERELRSFAAYQTPRLVAHEKEAEQLREKLIQDGFLGGRLVDWSKDRRWKLGDARTTSGLFAATAELLVIRAAAYYQKELLPEQRGLLCEIVIKENVNPLRGRFPGGQTDGLAASDIFFSPETSRLRLPSLPAELSAKIDAYTSAKEVLKAELRLTVVEQDRSSNAARTEAFRKLAERQWPRLAQLAERAEAIRHDLVKLPPPAPPPLPPQIPPELAARIEQTKAERIALDRERLVRLATIGAQSIFSSANRREIPSPQELSERMAARLQAQRQADEAFSQENADRFAALDRDLTSLSADLLEFAQAHLDPVTGDPMDVKILLSRVQASDRYFEQIAREEVLYKNYRIAMLEPGLSPEQRRLLFGAARVELAQPLPAGQPLPTYFIPTL